MDDISERINDFIAASEQARAVLSKNAGIEIESMDLQMALYEVLQIDPQRHWELLERQLTSVQILEHLKDFNFKKIKPELLGKVELQDSILPDGVPRILTEETIKVKGEIWRIHKNDADSFPSSPHAHNYESGVVLHLGTGEIFKVANRTSLGTIGCKKLLRLRGELGSFVLPPTGCE